MRIRWFGDPWPSAAERAPVCDNDDYRLTTPVGKCCLYCPQIFVAGDQGVIMATSRGDDIGWYELASGQPVVACHLSCLVRATAGPMIAAIVAEDYAERGVEFYRWGEASLAGPGTNIVRDYSVLGLCTHGHDLDREACPHGCRV